MVGQLATEHRKQAVGMSYGAADRRRVGAGGKVSLAAINCLARIILASPPLGVFSMASNSAWVYVWLPSIRVFTGQALE